VRAVRARDDLSALPRLIDAIAADAALVGEGASRGGESGGSGGSGGDREPGPTRRVWP
jgi:hypothetical protein